MKYAGIVYAALCIAGGFSACNRSATSAVADQNPQIIAEDDTARATPSAADAINALSAASALNNFGAGFYAQYRGDGGSENLVYSPYSMHTALAMLMAGARGETATQLFSGLGFTLATGDVHGAENALNLSLVERYAADSARFVCANSLWLQKGFSPEAAFAGICSRYYGAGNHVVDFAAAPAAVVDSINSWGAAHTGGLIPQFLADPLPLNTRLVLINAIYLKALWAEPFDNRLNREVGFFHLDGSCSTVTMMHGELSPAAALHADLDGATAVDLAYKNADLSLLLVMPDSGTFTPFESACTAAELSRICASLTPRVVYLTMPKFRIDATVPDAKAALERMGMALPMQSSADYSGISATENIFVDKIIHKAVIIVEEKGTEAAALTGIVGVGVGIPDPETRTVFINRPFLFFLRDRATGAVLFSGRVMNPGM